MTAAALPDRIGRAVYTLGFIGLSPVAPGTVASLAVAAASLALPRTEIYPYACGAGALAAGLLSWLLGRTAERVEARGDPGVFVIDEAAGMLLTLVAMPPPTLLETGIAFVLFRVFDILKPFPARQLERLSGGPGITLDDVVAGIYAAIGLHVLRWIITG